MNRHARGVGLIDGLIALAILSFGLLGMTRLQGRMISSATDAQSRTTAAQLADELLGTVLVDTANAACYTLPAAGACASPAASARTAEWAQRVTASLPGPAGSGVVWVPGSGRMTVSITWTDRAATEARLLQVSTDVR